MLDLNLEEAQFYRMLVRFFGAELVIPRMSVMAVCGGSLPQKIRSEDRPLPTDLSSWAKKQKCLFTVVDGDDTPRMVLDFDALNDGTVDPEKIEYQRVLRPLLDAAGVRFFTITSDEFAELLRPSGNLDLFTFFKARFEELGFRIGPDIE